VTGPTGSGKSTTWPRSSRRSTRRSRSTSSDRGPIEYLHPNDKATINQREVAPTPNFALALRAALRQARR